MALSYAHGAIQWLAADAATTVYTVSGLSFQPKAIRFYCQGLGSAVDADSESVNSRRGMGFATSTSDRRCMGTVDVDAAGSMDCGIGYRTDAVVVVLAAGGALDALLDLNSITSDGFTVIVDDQIAANLTVFWDAWGGSDITVATTGEVSEPAAAGDQDITVTGFTSTDSDDQVLFFAGITGTGSAPVAAANDSFLSTGLVTGGADAENIVLMGGNDVGSANSDCYGYCKTGECLVGIAAGGGSITAIAKVSAFITDGFRVTWAKRASTGRKYIFLAIKGGSWRAGSYTINGNTGSATATVSSLPFTPIGVVLMGRMSIQSTSDVINTQDRVGWGSGSATASRRTMGHLSEHSTGSAEIDLTIQYDQVLAFPSTAGALLSAYDINAMNSDGFQIIVDTAGGVASEWQGYLTFGDAGAAPTRTALNTRSWPLGTEIGMGWRMPA